MKQFIYDTITEIYRTASTDKYGQIAQFEFTPDVFGDKAKEVEEYNKTHNILQYSTYGGKCGIYKAFTIVDKELRTLCSEALRVNPNHIRNINSF